jgi:hypothetical protein
VEFDTLAENLKTPPIRENRRRFPTVESHVTPEYGDLVQPFAITPEPDRSAACNAPGLCSALTLDLRFLAFREIRFYSGVT